ncbi:MAG TPA: archaeosortase/exosortase family protein [Candidatus Hydrogenedentes bacterium]|nr:archaeosortase/exosortase family protein [Candidatus Hydrogenedentota bacterium]HOJ69244.1 archaeosortase/exosortase family protein [Candidatus Hydrogenedentota bacterium]HOK88972.1 archaeosortase/exosortase family protein [Candidatus Hydrogenedentota bacterium]HOV60114.1 archaeosortase/exosortase family protein [Candidatus Hydrogenedentota bacterium]
MDNQQQSLPQSPDSLPGGCQSEERTDGATTSHHQRPALRFVLVFALVVLSLLTGYRYAIHTELNDWYLFQVARHTAWALSWVAHSVELENRPGMNLSPKEVRAALAAWDAGREDPLPEEVDRASDAPLTPWEQWRYVARTTRARSPKAVNGPRVSLILTPGLQTESEELQRRIEAITRDTHLSEAERTEQAAALRVRLGEVQRKLEEIRRGQRDRSEDRSRAFPFIVVSECGAIEIMAIFIAAVLAFPATWRSRLIGLVAGVPLMYLVNIFRLFCLAIIGALDPTRKWFTFAHEYVWQAVFIIFVVAVWMAWVEYVARRTSR